MLKLEACLMIKPLKPQGVYQKDMAARARSFEP